MSRLVRCLRPSESGLRRRRPNKRSQPKNGARPNQKVTGETFAPSRLKRCSLGLVNADFDLMLLIAGMAFSVFGLIPLYDRRYYYRKWAQISAVVTGATGLFWGSLGILLYHSHVTISPAAFRGLR
jgi:hypothetical protein